MFLFRIVRGIPGSCQVLQTEKFLAPARLSLPFPWAVSGRPVNGHPARLPVLSGRSIPSAAAAGR